MSLVIGKDGTQHYPEDPDHFAFDSDVAEVFDDMAARSIPMYKMAHKASAYIAYEHIKDLRKDRGTDSINVMDVGASTGGFLSELMTMSGRESEDAYLADVNLHALDISEPMITKLKNKLPQVDARVMSVEDISHFGVKFDIINMSYVMQFLPIYKSVPVLQRLRSCMNKGGLLFVSQKELITSAHNDSFQNRYIRFRRENGYSSEEITAKTRALKGSMWPQSAAKLRGDLEYSGFYDTQECTRWLQFSSLVTTAR